MQDAPTTRITIREATEDDFMNVSKLMVRALEPYYGGDHRRHAERIFQTHISGGTDRLGFFSFEQKMFIAEVDGQFGGIVHLVGKRQNTYKISPLIVVEGFRRHSSVGSRLLEHAESYARARGARQLYCTVARENSAALAFFGRRGFVSAGKSASHYKSNVTEVMMYKILSEPEDVAEFDRDHISVVPFGLQYEDQVRALLLQKLPEKFHGIDDAWVTSLFEGHRRRGSQDVNSKYKLIYVATDPHGHVRGVVGATPKKGAPIKLMPLVADGPTTFEAILRDVPYMLKDYGRKLYLHMVPNAQETMSLQKLGWNLDGAMPEAYGDHVVTQQWSHDLQQESVRTVRVKKRFFDLIADGRKTLEVRVAYDNIAKIRPGDSLKLTTRDESMMVKVVDVRRYTRFGDMLACERADLIAPDDPDGLLDLLHDIYPPRKEELGVIVLELAL